MAWQPSFGCQNHKEGLPMVSLIQIKAPVMRRCALGDLPPWVERDFFELNMLVARSGYARFGPIRRSATGTNRSLCPLPMTILD
jgi:hypothetical protein